MFIKGKKSLLLFNHSCLKFMGQEYCKRPYNNFPGNHSQHGPFGTGEARVMRSDTKQFLDKIKLLPMSLKRKPI
jgi:hypothetical protein